MDYDVIIVGGGASGLACAAALAKNGRHIKLLVIEASERLGRKLAATGNGQGNISNIEMTASHYHGGNIALAEKIACADPFLGSRLFDCLFTADERGRIYPTGRQASALTDNLIYALRRCESAEILLGAKAIGIIKKARNFEVVTATGRYSARFAVLAAGGKAAKQFGTDGGAYKLATELGHRLTALYPSLVQLKTDTKYIKALKGIRVDCKVTAYSDGQAIGAQRGDVIFTDYGVSGNAVFSLSSYVTDRRNVTLSLEFLPDIPAQTIRENLYGRKKLGYAPSEMLSGTLHNRISRAIAARAANESGEKNESGDIEKIVETLKNFTLPVTGTLGFDYAQVTRGGIDMDGVTDGLESKFAPGLFFAGEILDVDGDCGGYNLQWAFASGIKVAEGIAKRL